jgi:hypothetical protein
MKQFLRQLFISFVIFGSITACGSDNSGANPMNSNSSNMVPNTSLSNNNNLATMNLEQKLLEFSIEPLTQNEIDDLLWIREEEKLAADVYQALANLHGLKIFTNISDSEITHTEAVRLLLNRYSIEDPVISTAMGVFTDQNLQKLHDDLVDAGTPTVDEALVVGAMIEELDIYDLKVAIDRLSNNEDIKMVYENLTKGSRNHLISFYKQITNRGGSYEPIYISQEEFLSIVNSSMEKGD